MKTTVDIQARGKYIAVERNDISVTPGGIELPPQDSFPTRDEPMTGTVVSVGSEADFEIDDVVLYVSRSATYDGYDLVHMDGVLATIES